VNLLAKDGHPIPTEFIAFANTDEHGRFAGANGSVRDMSEQTRLERELRESEERFRFLIENSPDIIFAIDPGGRSLCVGVQSTSPLVPGSGIFPSFGGRVLC